ncbi:hypothetical protein DSL72_002142 [Monilinia vaccinii-corymbosi]|uniref:SprT-like domain-containing protein n=1 Tax=Monilinia vaccinii-corymbosi TaxID=61207 RepID=A0A8A3PBR7_9HELO|nr:hypothetical protein DSL72_002142 [Monilinia vaccinii-corymbosi]
MGNQWVNSGPGGPWDEKYPVLPPENPGHRAPEPAEPIVYTGNPAAPYILKPASHTVADISEMIVRHTEERGSSFALNYRDTALRLSQVLVQGNLPAVVVLKDYFEFFNEVFFGGMIKDSIVTEFADDEWKNIFKLELVSDNAQGNEVSLGDNLGITSHVDSGYFRTTTIYIKDIRTGDIDEVFAEVMIRMLGTLAHEMIHAMEKLYHMYTEDEENVRRACHCNYWQVAARAIERATSGAPLGHYWLGMELDLGREVSAVSDIVLEGYKEPTALELQEMGFDAQVFKQHVNRWSRSIELKRKAAQWAPINEALKYMRE